MTLIIALPLQSTLCVGQSVIVGIDLQLSHYDPDRAFCLSKRAFNSNCTANNESLFTDRIQFVPFTKPDLVIQLKASSALPKLQSSGVPIVLLPCCNRLPVWTWFLLPHCSHCCPVHKSSGVPSSVQVWSSIASIRTHHRSLPSLFVQS